MPELLNSILYWFNVFILSYFLSLNTIYLILISLSFLYIRQELKIKKVYDLSGIYKSNLYKSVSILCPAFNEKHTISDSIHSLLNLQFSEFEVIVINDGSTDETLEVLIKEFELYQIDRYIPQVITHKPIKGVYASDRHPELLIIDKENGKKADALNAGVNAASKDLICSLDSDSVLESESLQQMLRAFIDNDNTVAVGGIVRVINGCKFRNGELIEIKTPSNFWARIQAVEYLRAFLFGRVGWNYLNGLLIISGAFGIFDRKSVIRVGGYMHDTVGEDLELVVRMHRYFKQIDVPYSIRFIPEPVCWTEVPETYKSLSRQRSRWQRGLADTMWRHKKMLFNPRYGILGFLPVPFYTFFETFGPVIEVVGYITVILSLLLGVIDYQFAILFFIAAILLGMIISILSIICEEFTFRKYPKGTDVLILGIFSFFENFGYRQLHAWWRMRGFFDFMTGKDDWGRMKRKGFSK